MATADKILLGTGVFSVGGVPVALTRGGGQFVVERTFRQIEADGDFGPVEGRQVIDGSVARLTVNGLDVFVPADLLKFYPGLANATGTITETLTIASGDYVDVQWVGKTKDGKAVTIKVDNALNLANIEWNLEDKNEVVPSLEFTGHYAEASRTTPPWSVVFAA
jgi:hypothetical protein